ncbi:MAG: hypothetical protein ABI113_08610 [Mucilaginibacter sp.]
MEEPTQLTTPLINVKRIKSRYFSIDEFNIANDAVFKVEFSHVLMIDSVANLIFFDLKVWYSIPQNENQNRVVLDCLVQNIFEVANIKSFKQDDGMIKLPNEILINIVSMAITHTRAVVAINTAGTVFQDTLIPVVDPVEATMAFFKEIPNHQTQLEKEEKVSFEDIDLTPTGTSKKKVKMAVK